MEKRLPFRADYPNHVLRAILDKRAILNTYTGTDYWYRFLERFPEVSPSYPNRSRKGNSKVNLRHNTRVNLQCISMTKDP